MTNQIYSPSCRIAFYLVALTTILSCNSGRREFARIKKYYQANAALHQAISDSLIAFCKSNRTRVWLKKPGSKEPGVIFSIPYEFDATVYSVFYDSAFNRHDDNPERTSMYTIPISVIKNFNEIKYDAAAADSDYTFFAGKWDGRFQLGTQGNRQFGILVSSDTSISKRCEKRLSAHA